MYRDRLELTKKDILEKDFKLDTRGYRPQEVDSFLDVVIHDYNEVDKIINEFVDEKEEMIKEISILNKKIRDLEASVDSLNGSGGVTNLDIIKRLSDLEKKVYEE